MADTEEPAAPAPSTAKQKAPRWRRILGTVLVVLGCVLAPISIHTVWLHGTLLNTDQYVSTVGPLASNPNVQNALANRITNSLVDNSNIETRLNDALPPKADFIVPVVVNGLKPFVHNVALKIVQAPKFQQLWEGLNRRVHNQVVKVLRGEGRSIKNNGQVVINIQPVIDRVNTALQKVGVTSLMTKAGQSSHNIVLFSSSELESVQSVVRVFDDLVIVLPILTVLAFAGAIALSGDRRRTIFRSAVALAGVMLLFLVIWNVLRNPYQHALPRTVDRAAAGAVYDQLVSFLLLALRTVFAVAVVVALGAWLAGPSRRATRIRAGARNLIARAPGSASPPRLAQFVDRYRNLLRAVVIVLGLVLLVLLNHPSPLAVLVIAIIVLVLLGVIELVGRVGEAKPAATSSPPSGEGT